MIAESKRRETGAALQVMEATLASGALVEQPASFEPSGRKWRVRIFEYGLSKNRYPWDPGLANRDSRLGKTGSTGVAFPESRIPTRESRPLQWTEASARAALRHLDGARCFADHGGENSGNGHSVRDLVGFFAEPAMGPRGPEATLTLLESESWARTKLLGAWRAGRMDLIGFSVDAVIAVRPVGDGAARALEVEQVVAIHSVDMVSAASSGGKALEVLESRDSGLATRDSGKQDAATPESRTPRDESGEKGAGMKQAIQRMLEALPEVRDSGAGIPPEIAQRSVLTRAAGTDGMTPPDSQSANPDQALREALQAELAAAEVDPERVLQALADWLASRDSRLATREMKPQSPSSESRVPS